MTYEEAQAWLRGECSCINYRLNSPADGPAVAKEDAALTEQAYWIVRAHREGLVETAATEKAEP